MYVVTIGTFLQITIIILKFGHVDSVDVIFLEIDFKMTDSADSILH